MCKVAIMQPYLFPYIGYFQLLSAADKFVVFDDVNYINKGWINRNNILVNGEAALFTLSLQGASQNKLIYEIEISEKDKWKDKFLKTLQMTYKKAPCYTDGIETVEKIFSYKDNNLSSFLCNSIKILADYLDIQTEIISTSRNYDTSDLKGQDKIIKICTLEKATQYINPIGGLELYSMEAFERFKIKLTFIKTNPISYTQFNNKFVPNLSIIDLIMFNGKETKAFLNDYIIQDGV